VAYAVLAIAFTWPIAKQLSSVVPHDLGDPLTYMWIFWWNTQAPLFTDAWLNAPIFYPATGAIVYQDALLGLWPITTPMLRLGASPVTVHNVLLIGGFAVSGFAAYLLCLHLFRDRVAAFAGGLVYGFAIYRVSQINHLNLILTPWLPLILLGLHEYLATRRWRWLLFATAAWVIQGLTAGYFLVYAAIVVGLWTVYFFRGRLADYLRVAAAFGTGLAVMAPMLWVYRSVHAEYGFRRGAAEADGFGADVLGLIQAPSFLTVWGRWLGDERNEDQFFPGMVLALACAAVMVTSRYWSKPWWSRASLILVGIAALFAAAAAAAVWSPGSVELAGVQISLSRPYKPLSWVWLALLAALFVSPPLLRVFRDRSVAGFYAISAFVLWILALGPTVRVAGERIWYKAPFSWLYLIPGSESVRVPARLWLLVVLALGVLVAYGLMKWRRRSPTAGSVAAAVVSVAVLVEAWPGRLPLPAPPERFAQLEGAPSGSPVPVLELPMDPPGAPHAAMYRAIYHGRPVVNGASGHTPTWQNYLMAGLSLDDAAALRPLTERMPIDIVVHSSDPDADRLARLVARAGGQPLATDERFRLFHLPQRPALESPPVSPRAALARMVTAAGDVTSLLADPDVAASVAPQELEIALQRACLVDEVQLGVSWDIAGVRIVDGSAEARELWAGSLPERGVRAALADPRHPRLRLRLTPTHLDTLRIQPRVVPGGPLPLITSVAVFGPDCTR
jgi:hypothetical protein